MISGDEYADARSVTSEDHIGQSGEIMLSGPLSILQHVERGFYDSKTCLVFLMISWDKLGDTREH